MAKEVSLKIVADAAQASTEAKNLKAELKAATKEAQNLAAAGKTSTAEYIAARNKVAELKDQMRDFNEEVAALDPGKKFQSIAGVASGIAGGLQAATGAMALFGAESKDVERALLKVQAATALAQGIDQVRELGEAFNLAKIAISSGVQSLGKMRAALVATGVGAIAVAVGTLAANWESVKEWIDKTIPSLGGIGNLFNNVKKIAMGALGAIIEHFKVIGEVVGNLFKGEFSKAVEVAGQFGERVSKAYSKGFIEEEENQAKEREAAILEGMKKSQERQIRLLEAQGKDTYALKKKQLEDELRLVELQKGKESDEYKDAYLNLQLLEIEHQKKMSDLKKAKDDAETKAYFERINTEATRQQGLNQIQDDYQKLNDERNQKSLDAVNSFANRKIEIEQFSADAQNKIEEDRAKRSYDLEQQELAIKYQMAQDSLSIVSNLGNLLIKDQEKLEKFNKRAALVQIGIDTAKALSLALANANAPTADNVASGGIAGIAKYITLAATITANALRAKQILQGAGSSAGAGAASTPTLSIPNSSGTPTTNAPGGFNTSISGQRVANQSGAGASEGGQFKVYVLESDITDTQNGVAGIKRKAKVL